MPVADFHNDVLTAIKCERLLNDYDNSENEIVCAYFKGNRSFAETYSVSRTFNNRKYKNMYLAFEDVSYSSDLSVLKALLDLKPVYATLTWNSENIFGGGAHSTVGLTALGKKAIKLLNENNVALDLAHLNEKTYYEALDLADTPVCSHTCFYHITKNRRNITGEQISSLIQKNGIIGLTFYKPFITENRIATAENVIAHIDYFCELFPHNHLAIGTDFNGCDSFPKGFGDYSFENLLREQLKKRGYSDIVIEDILYNNLSRFLKSRKI